MISQRQPQIKSRQALWTIHFPLVMEGRGLQTEVFVYNPFTTSSKGMSRVLNPGKGNLTLPFQLAVWDDSGKLMVRTPWKRLPSLFTERIWLKSCLEDLGRPFIGSATIDFGLDGEDFRPGAERYLQVRVNIYEESAGCIITDHGRAAPSPDHMVVYGESSFDLKTDTVFVLRHAGLGNCGPIAPSLELYSEKKECFQLPVLAPGGSCAALLGRMRKGAECPSIFSAVLQPVAGVLAGYHFKLDRRLAERIFS